MPTKRLKHNFAALITNREGGKSKLKIHDCVQVVDIMTTMMSEEFMQANSDFIRTEVVDFLEMDARKKYKQLKKRAAARKK